MSRLVFHCRHRYKSGFMLDASFATDARVTALVGPSGTGKSTILSLIAGLLRPEFGTIRLGGRVLLDTAAQVCVAPEGRQIGLVFQDHLLFPHLTVEQNLRYGLRRRPARTIEFAKLVAILELEGLLQRSPRTLSGGQRQRVALGRAMLRGPELLLMDEPLTALDERLKVQILDYLKRAIYEFAIPTLLVSHDRADVERLADRVITIEGGGIAGGHGEPARHASEGRNGSSTAATGDDDGADSSGRSHQALLPPVNGGRHISGECG